MVFWFEQCRSMSLYAGKALHHLTTTQIHALHRSDSIFAGMVMFTGTEVLRLRTLSKVSRQSLVDWSIYNAL